MRQLFVRFRLTNDVVEVCFVLINLSRAGENAREEEAEGGVLHQEQEEKGDTVYLSDLYANTFFQPALVL